MWSCPLVFVALFLKCGIDGGRRFYLCIGFRSLRDTQRSSEDTLDASVKSGQRNMSSIQAVKKMSLNISHSFESVTG